MLEEEYEAIEQLEKFKEDNKILGLSNIDKPINILLNLIKIQKHRLEVANVYIESRKHNMIPEHYDDLKYIINECDLDSSW